MSTASPTTLPAESIPQDPGSTVTTFKGIAAFLIGLFSIVVIQVVLRLGVRDSLVWLGLLPFASICLLALSVPLRHAWSRRKFAAAQFQALAPAIVGGRLAGFILTERPLKFDTEILLTLACIYFDNRRSGRHDPYLITAYSTLWHHEVYLTHDLPTDVASTRIPVYFEIPEHCHPTDWIGINERHFWRLTAESKAGGSRFHADFLVPVNPAPEERPAPDVATPDVAAQYRVPAPAHNSAATAIDRGIKITESAGDELDISFAAAHHPALALIHTVYLAFFLAMPITIAYLALVGPVGITIYAVVCALFSLAVFPTVIRLWFNRSRLLIRARRLELTHRWLLFSRTRRFDSSDIATVGTILHYQRAHQDDLYTLRLKTRQGRYCPIADAVARRDADRVAARMRKALALEVKHRAPKPSSASM